MDAKEYAIVIKSVCSTLGGITPDDTLIRNVTLYCKSLNHALLKEKYKSSNERYESISKSYIESIQPSKEFDFKDYLRKEDQKHNATVAELESVKKKIEPLTNWVGDHMPMVSSKAMGVYLDSRIRNMSDYSSNNPIIDFAFALVPRQTRAEIGDGRIQVRVIPSQITYFKLGRIVLPYGSILRQRNFTNELTLTFTALRSNGIIAREDTYHFAFTYEVCPTNSNLVILSPINEYCKFNPPLNILDDLSLRFSDPFVPVSFLNDRLRPSQINYLSSDGRIVFDTPHNLEDNDVIIVMGLATLDDSINANIISVINDPRGISITKVNNSIIATGIDFTTIQSPDTQSKPWIFFYSRMFRFPLEIGYQG